MIEAHGLVKRYGSTMAVNDLSFSIRPGLVTGFLGPNGAGKTTTMRMILGLDAPTQGSVTVGGRSYRDLPAPMREVGALLDAKALHGGRRARDHLLCLAQSNGIPRSRVDEVLRIVGLEGVARRRAKGFSLGMGQRLGIASALLGDPAVLMFDEPVNGLDPDGIHWVRSLMRDLAAEGRTVLVSSHLMSEMALTADHLLVIGKGRLIADTSVDEFVRSSSRRSVHVRSPQAADLAARCREAGATVRPGSTSRAASPVVGPDAGTGPDVIEITGEVTSFAAFFVGQALISGHAPHAALGDPGVARAVVGAGLYLTALAVLSVAAGTLLRHPAAAIASMMAVVLVLPLIAQALPNSWRNPVTEFWPTQAGSQLTSVYHSAHTLQPWPGFGVMCLFVAIVYAIAWTLLDRRDA
jgi:ABC-2 type transport system ATP-binding protein